jgi:CheY-like chemotaxis protein
LRPRVLLADDYPDMVKAVSRLLAVDCEIVGSVTDGSALLQAAQRLQPDVIVLDVNLPNVLSLEACREIDHACESHDESDCVHGDERRGRQPGVLRGGSICLRIKSGGCRPAVDDQASVY